MTHEPNPDLYRPPLAHMPLSQLIQQQLLPRLDSFFDLLDQQPFAPAFNGVPVFETGDRFLPGKVAISLVHLVLLTPADSPRRNTLLQGCRRILHHIAGMPHESWGIYYAMMALNRLRRAGLLAQAIDETSLRRLREALDWRHFVDAHDFRLLNLPTNYYGVAFGVARLRMLMGWEDASAADTLLERTMTHYERYSGVFGFSDETEGEGRFDRYSILLIAELCERFIETELAVTPRLRQLLRQSAELALRCANEAGDGFAFGRSTGPYGDTAIVEILAAAACLGELTPDEQPYAYALCVRACAKYLDHWFDPELGSVNLWHKGRSTDAYRGPHRMFGENLSLIHQFVTTSELWDSAGLHGATPRADLGEWLARTQPAFALTWFARGDLDRALAVRRNRGLVFQLPLINGGVGQHAHAPYYPLPFAPRVIEGRADSGPAHPQLLPRLVLADGSELLPNSFMRAIVHEQRDCEHRLGWRQDGLNRLGAAGPQFDARVAVDTEVIFGDGWISCSDHFTPRVGVQIRSASLEFASFSGAARVAGNRVEFGDGVVRAFEVEGLCDAQLLDIETSPLRCATSGPMRTHLRFQRDGPGDAPLTVRWTLHYR